jgi:hypothetical protein
VSISGSVNRTFDTSDAAALASLAGLPLVNDRKFRRPDSHRLKG